MSKAPSETALDEFFEEVWQLAELAAGSEDRHLAPHLFELAEHIAWASQPEGDASDLSVARPDPQLIEASQGFRQGTALEDHDGDGSSARLDIMAERLSRQRMVVSRMERIGQRRSIELAYQLLRLMQDSIEITRYRLAVSAGINDRPKSVND